LKILKFFDADADPGSGIFLIRDPVWKNLDPGPGINIPDPQHLFDRMTFTIQQPCTEGLQGYFDDLCTNLNVEIYGKSLNGVLKSIEK
jgi:hypothetical protein